jgi:hypothetical protein
VRLYGSGYFMAFLGVSVPASRNRNVQLADGVRHVARMFAEGGFEEGELPYPCWPEPGGLLPFGATDNGDYLLWLTRGSPAAWRVVVWDRRLGNFEVFDCDLTDFLAGLAGGEIEPEEFPDDLLPCDCLFAPNADVEGGVR